MRKALEAAKARATRSRSVVQEVLASAVIRTELEPTPKVVVSFTAHPFKGGLHQIYDFSYPISKAHRIESCRAYWHGPFVKALSRNSPPSAAPNFGVKLARPGLGPAAELPTSSPA
jgi:hypothetical protein